MPKARTLVLGAWLALLAAPALAATITDVQPIPLRPGVNAVPHMGPDGRDGLIVQGFHSDSPIADGGSIQFLVLLKASDGWETIGMESLSKSGPDEELIRSIPHVGEDWKRAVAFARAMVDGKAAFVMLVAERDMSKVETVYDPVPVDVRLYRLQSDAFTEQDHLALVDRQRTARCYVNAWLALKDVTAYPLPPDYEGPKASQPCPK